MRGWSVLENVSWVGVISPVAGEPAARDRCRGLSYGGGYGDIRIPARIVGGLGPRGRDALRSV